MNFSEAIDALRAGTVVRRAGWNAGAFLYFVPADSMSATSAEVRRGIHASSRFGGRIALMDGQAGQFMWKITAEDEAATDWEVLSR